MRLRLAPARRFLLAAVRAVAVVVVLAVLVTDTPAGHPATAGAQALAPPSVTDPAPAPGDVVPAGDTWLRARILTPDALDSARFVVDGRVVPAQVGPAGTPGGAEVRARVHLPAGAHRLRVEAEDTRARQVERVWTVTAAAQTMRRHAGRDRVDTAAAVSAATFPHDGSAPAAVLARSDDFADALAGVPLAADVEGPLLLSAPSALPEATARELRRAVAAGGVVHLLGGDNALDGAVARAVADLGFSVRRHAGPDRFATAAQIARALPPSPAAVVASGRSFPDALAASVPAARRGWPVVLTAPGGLPDVAARVLAERSVTVATVVGGVGAVSAEAADQVAAVVPEVRRVAGDDRYATAVAVADAFAPGRADVSLASGEDFPDALAGARHAAVTGQPLLLARTATLPAVTADAVAARRPSRLDVYGGPGAVGDGAVGAAVRAAVDGPHAPRVTVTRPGRTAAYLDIVEVRLDRPVDPASSSVHVEVGGREVAGVLDFSGPTDALTVRVTADDVAPLDTAWPGRIVVRAVTADGAVGHHAAGFTYLQPDPLFAVAGGVGLHLPSRDVEMIGYHEANHPGARQQTPRATATPTVTLASRGRGTGSHTAADVVASPDEPVRAPVTGRVARAGSYVLYCRHTDDFVVIEPDARPGWEVKLLHVHGLQVRPGDRVVAGQTLLAAGPRTLPFASQVDAVSRRGWPHIHVEVVDPSIPPRPGRGC